MQGAIVICIAEPGLDGHISRIRSSVAQWVCARRAGAPAAVFVRHGDGMGHGVRVLGRTTAQLLRGGGSLDRRRVAECLPSGQRAVLLL